MREGEEYWGENRLEGVGKRGRNLGPATALYAFGQDQVRAEVQIPGNAFQRLASDQRGKTPR